MNQSRAMSLVEAVTSAIIGYLVAVMTQFAVFPLFGLAVGLIENLEMGFVFTAVSILRTYALRRVFERFRHART